MLIKKKKLISTLQD